MLTYNILVEDCTKTFNIFYGENQYLLKEIKFRGFEIESYIYNRLVMSEFYCPYETGLNYVKS